MGRQGRRRAFGGCFLSLIVLLFTASWAAENPVDFFRRNCASCHTIGGGRLTGPDLKNVTQRKEREWLVRFMVNPKAVIDAGDPYAVKLREESRGVVMPTIPGLNKNVAETLLDLIDAESALEVSQFVGLQISDEPFTQLQIENGRKLFVGTSQLQNGGPACISCHTTALIPSLGGGRLGPDLTLVYERLQGRKGVASWLLAPATPTMQKLFAQQPLIQSEILDLTAYLEEAAKRGGQSVVSAASLTFILLGISGSVVSVALFDVLWKKRFRNVRRSQYEGTYTRRDDTRE